MKILAFCLSLLFVTGCTVCADCQVTPTDEHARSSKNFVQPIPPAPGEVAAPREEPSPNRF